MTDEEFKIEAKRVAIKHFLSSAKSEDWKSVSFECDNIDIFDSAPVDIFNKHAKEHRMLAKVVAYLHDKIQVLEAQLAKK